MNQTFKTLILLIFILLINQVFPQNQNLRFEHVGIEDGLSQSTINCIYQDSKGFMWFATQEGLNRFDGYNFKIYRLDLEDPNSISENDIWAICEDKIGNLWIGTHGGGLNCYNFNKEKFQHFKFDKNTIRSINDNNAEAHVIDSQDSCTVLWIGTWDGGLNKLVIPDNTNFNDLKDNIKFTHYTFDPNNSSSISNNNIHCITKGGPESLWIGTDNGLNKFDIKNEKFIRFLNEPGNKQSLSNNIVYSIYVNAEPDKSGNLEIWVGTQNGLNRINEKLNTENKKSKYSATYTFKHYFNNSRNNSLVNNEIYSIIKDQHGCFWIGTYGGVSRLILNYEDNTELFYNFKNIPTDPYSLAENHITQIYEDKSGMIWFGTHDKGLNKFENKTEKFKHFINDATNPNSLNDNHVKSLYFEPTESGDILWIGTHNGGLNRYDKTRQKFTHYKKINSNPNSLGHNRIISIYKDTKGIFWLGAYRGGLQRFDPQKEVFKQYVHNPTDSKSLSDNDIPSILEDTYGTLWLGTYGGGLNEFVREKEIFIHHRNDPQLETSLGSDKIRIIHESIKGNNSFLWIGSEEGLSKSIRHGKKIIGFKNYHHKAGNPNSLVNNYVYSIHEDSVGNLWIGTTGGLSKLFLDKDDNENFTNYTMKNGLPNNIIYGILEDDQGNLWLSTNNGLSKFNPLKETFKNYDEKDGLQSNEFNLGAYCKGENGEMYFGGINGFNTFQPQDIQNTSYLPPIVITDFQILNKSVPVGKFDQNKSILDQSITSAKQIILSHKDYVFSFEFAALHFYTPEKNKYAYMLEGFETEWNYIDAHRRYASYTNLDPGKYIFRVKGTNNDGLWNETGAAIKILITPPYWQTSWFRALITFLGLGILYVIYRYRLSQLLAIERMRVRIASDLHDDVGSALTKIAMHSEIIQSNKDQNKLSSSSKKIGIISREVITTMSDIVWSIDARNDKIKDLVDRMRDFALTMLSDQEIKVNFTHFGLDENKKLAVNYRQNIYLIFKESINNIVKHANCTEVTISLHNSTKLFAMEIEDNGGGFDTSDIKRGIGLNNMKLRAERIGGKVNIKSKNGINVKLSLNGL